MAGALSTRDAKMIQYLNEAYGKDKELETALHRARTGAAASRSASSSRSARSRPAPPPPA